MSVAALAAVAAMPNASALAAQSGVQTTGLQIGGIALEFFLFAAILAGIAALHRHALKIALGGLAVVTLYKLAATGFPPGPGTAGLIAHLHHEWVTLANLFGLITGFALLANHFHRSRVPELLPRYLPDDWKGGFVLLALVFVLSGFLDNIAAALIGGTMASAVFRAKLHVGYLAAVVAASNAGGAGSVVGDTTTTMMWIDGVSPLEVLHAYVAAGAALLVFGVPAAIQQQRYAPIIKDAPPSVRLDYVRLLVVAAVLFSAIGTNVVVNGRWPEHAAALPWIGAAVWMALLTTAAVRSPDFSLLPEAARSSIFLLSLVLTASMMPVHQLPAPSWQSTFALGFVSAVFDNIPLTAMALQQGGYDWGMLAYAVGFGGSMIWFGSSAGVALCGVFPQGRSVLHWVRAGWHVALGYVVGFAVLLLTLGWNASG
jgi:Na+/H+ antiporter NhaD/arsenite permease-like protein